MKKDIIQYTKEIVQFIFWVLLFLSIFVPHSLDFWLSDGFLK